jgi:TrmH family RNA methyltransferase
MPETISSPHNQHLKEIRRLQRRRERDASGRFVAEGEDLLAAADAAGWTALERYCATGSGLAGVQVAPDALAKVSSMGSGTRALAVYEQRWSEPSGPLCVYLHGISDPGNVGAVLRSAAAFGASSVALDRDSADPFGPKAVRASMGAIFAVPVARIADPAQLPGRRIALVAGSGQALRDATAQEGPVTLMIGAEREGLPEQLVGSADAVAQIPILTDSLNAAMAATVALYELSKNRMTAR